MAGYSRQSSYSDGDTIQAADSNDEFNQLLAAFVATTGHAHDGTALEGPVIGLIGDPGVTTPLNKVEISNVNNRVGFFVDVASVSVEQLRLADGVLSPVTDNDIDLGTASLEFKDGYFDGTLYTDTLSIAGTTDVVGILDEDTLVSDSATNLATQQSIKAYVDAQLTASDLDFSADSGGALSIDLDSETLTLTGGTGITTTGLANDVSFAIDSTVATLTGTQTLTNKTISFTSNTVTATSLELKTALSDETGSGAVVFANTPTLVTPALGTPGSGILTNTTGYPGDSSLVTSGALNSGSITSGFGNIDIGSSTFDTTGAVSTGALTIGGHLAGAGFDITSVGTLSMTEQVAANLDVAGDGQVWVKTAIPNQLWFTDDAGSDFQLASLAGTETFTNKTLTSPTLTSPTLNGTLSGTAFLDEDTMSSNSAIAAASQQSIKAYVDAQLTASDLDFSADSGGALSIDLDSETLTLTGGTGITTTGLANDVSFAIDSTVATLTGSQTLTNKTINLTSNTLTATSLQLKTALTDETGSGSVVFATSPTLVTPALGTPASGVMTNVTGTAASLTAGNVTTNANLTGHVTSVGNAAVLGSFTSAQLATALTNETGTGSAVFATSPTLVTPALGTPASGVMTNVTGTAASLTAGNVTTNANLTGHVTSVGNAAVLGSFTLAQLNSAVSDATIVDLDNADTLTNKTIALGSNTVSGTFAQFNTAVTDETLVGLGSSPVWTGAHDFGGATSLELPNSATPTVNANGEIAIDTTVTDFSAGVLKYFSTEEMAVVAMPIAELTTPADSSVVSYNATTDEFELVTAGAGDALVANPLSQFAATTSAQLAGVISNETGSGALVFATSPTLVTPALGTPASGVMTNVTGTAASLTAGNVTTNANLTGHVTSVGNAAVLGSFTSAQLATALTNETGTGSAVFATSPTLVTPALGTPASGVMTNVTGTASSLTAGNVTTNANLTGHVTSVGNAAVLGSFTVAQLSTALSDASISGNNTGDEAAASLTVSGVVELATVAETSTGTDATRAMTPAGLAGVIGDTVQAYDADTLKADTSDTLTAGFDSDEQDLGTISSGTTTLEVDAANEENFKKCVNGGAFVLSPPSTSSSCVIVLRVTNNGSAGAITFTGFTVQDGDDLTTTNGDDFFITVIECGGFSSATVKALQ